MSIELFSKLLSQNYIELLEDNEYYDITIEVGEDPNNDNGVLSHIKLPNISPEIFQIILRYIYGGILSFNGQETSDILEIMQKVRPYQKLLSKQLYEDLICSYMDPDIVSTDRTDEIIGGYNPLKWESSADTWGITNGSFIFSFINKNIKDAIISNVINLNHAIYFNTNCGPYFGDDIVFYNSKDQFTDYDKIRCKKCCYEKKIRDSEDYFSIEDYEVFQIIKR
ncbi:BTB/POZ protein [Rhizophagus irregularis DAOM 181602=DAOM 197198]|nr:BTB/POZ protein [Rhizophagus irregularis DAOM 181602=DAOM 197198]